MSNEQVDPTILASLQGFVPPNLPTVHDTALALYKPPFRYLHGYVYDANCKMVADDKTVDSCVISRIRGWGALSYLPNGAELQDAIGRIVAEALNKYWAEAAADKGSQNE